MASKYKYFRFLTCEGECEGEYRVGGVGTLSSLLWELGQKTDSYGRWQISSARIKRSGIL